MPLSPFLLKLSEIFLKSRAYLAKQIDQTMAQMSLRARLRIEDFIRSLVHIKTTRGRCNVDFLVLKGGHGDVHEVAVHPPPSRGRIPGGGRQDLQTGQLVFAVVDIVANVRNMQRK